MSLRHIKPIAKAGLVEADMKGAVKPKFENIDPSTLMVDEVYQRNLSERSMSLIRKIIANWSWAKFKPPIVVKTASGYVVIDGQHTAIAAASHSGIASIPVMIVHAPDLVDQSAAFLGHNRDRLAMTSMQMHHAAVVAGDPVAVVIDEVVTAAGVKILRGPPGANQYKHNETVAIDAIRRMIKRRGRDNAVLVMQAVAGAKLAPVGQAHIMAAEALMFDPEFHGVRPAAVTSAIINIGYPLDQEAKMFGAMHGIKQHWKAVAAVLYRKINHGRRRAA